MRSGLGAFAAVGGRGVYCRCVGVFYAVWTDASKGGFDEARIREGDGACGAIVVDCARPRNLVPVGCTLT